MKITDKRIIKALEIANTYGSFDGAHHKMWCIDQMVRALCGTEDIYKRWVAAHRDGDEGPDSYEWEEGTPP